ncbi:preprotein translocase subunit SecG [Orbus wheelerorum]|uniref:preprotein translocase subunit SecG n=1 Tax=Orbus wheelerorum TaxID=3074111 RepID=UPI00370D9B75
MYEILIIVFLIVAIAIVGLVLIQKGKGADMGASFGSGASATLFGSGGTGNFLTRTTTILGVIFFIISIALSNIGSRKTSNDGFWNLEEGTTSSSPAQSASNTDLNQTSDSKVPATTKAPEPVNPTSDIPE